MKVPYSYNTPGCTGLNSAQTLL